jgi:hypothetical protein
MEGATFRMSAGQTSQPPWPHGLLVAGWTAGGVAMLLMTPLLAPILLALSTILPPFLYRLRVGRLPPGPLSAITIVLSAAGIYLAINSTWSLGPASAFMTVGVLFLIIAALHVTLNALHSSNVDELRAMSWGFYAGVIFCGVVLCIEAFSQQWMHRLLTTHLPIARPAPRHMHIQNGVVDYLPPYLLNRCILGLTLLFWPMVLVCLRLGETPARRALLLAGLVPVVAAIFRSSHGTSKIAFLGAALLFALFWYWPRLAKGTAAIYWLVATLLFAPIASIAYAKEMHLSRWLPQSGQHRIVIWGYTAEQIPNAPLFGVGINTTRAMGETTDYDRLEPVPGTGFKRSTNLHAHSGYLQTWYEAGAVGVAFLLTLGLFVLRSFDRAPEAVQPFYYATFLACALGGASSFNLWQPWFMASFGFAAVFATLAGELAMRGAPGAAAAPA